MTTPFSSFAEKLRRDTAREAAEITAIVLREAADRFEQECPDADGELDLCMCHAAPVLRAWADEAVEDAEETHVVADDSDDPEHIDDCPGCTTTP